MIRDEMTIAEVLKDPLIRKVMRADRVSVNEMRHFLQDAARIRETDMQTRSFPGVVPPARVSSGTEA